MPIDYNEKKYPICDADFWIKISKIQENKKLINEYGKLWFSDAVYNELYRDKLNKDKVLGLNFYRKYKRLEKIKLLALDGEYFNSKDRKNTRRLFLKCGIVYDEKQCTYRKKTGGTKNVGEIISLIYANIHDLKLFLSDDVESKDFSKQIIKKYPYVKVMKLEEVLQVLGFENIENLLKIANMSEDDKEDKEENIKAVKQGRTMTSFKGLKDILLMKECIN